MKETIGLEALVVLVDDQRKVLTKLSDPLLLKTISEPLKNDFRGRYKEAILLYCPGHATMKRIMLIGVGSLSQLSAQRIRALAATAVQNLKGWNIVKGTALLMPQLKKLDSFEIGQAWTEGARLAQLNYNELRTERKDEEKAKYEILQFSLVALDKRDQKLAQEGAEKGMIIAESVNWGRRLIMMPPGDLYPETYVKEIQRMIASNPAKSKIKMQVWDDKELQKNKFGGVLGVGQGAEHSPRFVILEYWGGKKSEAPLALVGKGITFDSGGLSLKPPASQETMKYDMAGSASVISAFKIATELGLKVNLLAFVPMAENMPSGTAIRPGDVLRMASGKTVEVLNTDAEGRLILADALFWASTKYKPRAIVDVATLTGVCALSVGEAAAGVFTNNNKLLKALSASSDRTGDNIWPLPNYPDFYLPAMKSEVADIKNVGHREAGASSASMFLQMFVLNDVPWAHLDIAGCGWYDGPRDYITTKGASGVPIRLLADFVENFGNAKFS